MTRPEVSQAAETLYETLAHLADGDPQRGWPLLVFCEAAGRMLQRLDDLARDTPDGPGWSQVLDPDRVPADALPWLGQWVGAAVDTDLTVAEQRAQVAAKLGFARGTPAAIIAAGQPYLGPGQEIKLHERVGGDAYVLGVSVFGYALIGASYSQLGAQFASYADLATAYPTYGIYSEGTAGNDLRQALMDAKPAGLLLEFSVATGAVYDEVTTRYGTYAGLSSRWLTYEDMTNAAPGT